MNVTEISILYNLGLLGILFPKRLFFFFAITITDVFVYKCTLIYSHMQLGMLLIWLVWTCNLANCFHGNKDEILPAQGMLYLGELRKSVM